MPARDPIERVIANQFDIEALVRGLDRKTARRVRRLFNDLVAELARSDITSVGNQRAKVQDLLRKIRPLIGDAFEDWRKIIRQDLAEIGSLQAAWARQTIVQSLGGAPAMGGLGISLSDPTQLGVNFFKSIVDTNPFEGQVLAEWAETQSNATLVRVRKEIQLGLANNETIDDIIRRVRGRSAGRGRFSGGAMEATTRQAEAIARTAVNDIATTAHLASYGRESEVTTTYQYVATLDSRTTLICASLDGREFAYDDPDAKRPPQHVNCRSTVAPIIDWESVGLPEPPDGIRATQGGGRVPESWDYERWLREKPASEQDRILGPERAKLLRDGVSLRDMVRDDGTVLTVEQLRERAA